MKVVQRDEGFLWRKISKCHYEKIFDIYFNVWIDVRNGPAMMYNKDIFELMKRP